MCGDPLHVVQGVGISKDGLPNCLKAAGKSIFRNNDKMAIKVVLSALSIGKLIPGDKVGSTADITTPWTGFIPLGLHKWI